VHFFYELTSESDQIWLSIFPFIMRRTGVIEPLGGIAGPARYPAISPDGKRLAFSCWQWGSWHLVVRELATESSSN
jgi:hypothetical protein